MTPRLRHPIIAFCAIVASCAAPIATLGQGGGIFINPTKPARGDSVILFEAGLAKGFIFSATYRHFSNQGRFTPTFEEIYQVEEVIRDKYDEVVWDSLEAGLANMANGHTNPADRIQPYREALLEIHDIDLKRISTMYRQYLGIHRDNGDRCVLVQLIDFSTDPMNLKTHVDKFWIHGWHGWFHTDTRTLSVCLNSNKLHFDQGWIFPYAW